MDSSFLIILVFFILMSKLRIYRIEGSEDSLDVHYVSEDLLDVHYVSEDSLDIYYVSVDS